MDVFILFFAITYACVVIGFIMSRRLTTLRNTEKLDEYGKQVVWVTIKRWFTKIEFPIHLNTDAYYELLEKVGGGVENCLFDVRTPKGDAHEERVCLDLLAAGDEVRMHIVVPSTELLKSFTQHTMAKTLLDPRLPIHEEQYPPMPPRPEGQLVAVPHREVQAALAELPQGPSVIVAMNDEVVEAHRPTIAHTPAPAEILETRRDEPLPAVIVDGNEPENSARKTLFMGSPPRRRDPDQGA